MFGGFMVGPTQVTPIVGAVCMLHLCTPKRHHHYTDFSPSGPTQCTRLLYGRRVRLHTGMMSSLAHVEGVQVGLKHIK